MSTTRTSSFQNSADDRTGFRVVCTPSFSPSSATTPTTPTTPTTATTPTRYPLPYVSSEDVSSKGWSVHASNLRRVPSGIFTMGTDDAVSGGGASSRPSHRVFVQEYWIGSREVTVGEYRAFVQATNHTTEAPTKCTSSLAVSQTVDEATGTIITTPVSCISTFSCNVLHQLYPSVDLVWALTHLSFFTLS